MGTLHSNLLLYTVQGLAKRMKVAIIIFCLMGAVFANPILYKLVLEPSGLKADMTLSSSASQSSESNTSELQSSEENTSNQSSESESSESTSEDETSEESDSQSLEDRTASMGETRDNSMASEENIRKGWIQVFTSVVRVLSAEDNSSAEVKGQPDHPANKQTKNQLSHTPTTTGATFEWTGTTAQSNKNLSLVETPTNSESPETSLDSSDNSDLTSITDSSQSSESTSSDSSESSETSESRDTSESTESDSADLQQIKSKNCQQGVDSTGCESEEYFFQDIGDDDYYPVAHLMMPDEEHRELSLRR